MKNKHLNGSTSNEVKNKLFMRIMVRFSEIFGGEQQTLEVIKEVMDQELADKTFLNAEVSYILLIFFIILLIGIYAS
jgi:hypothetical protein